MSYFLSHIYEIQRRASGSTGVRSSAGSVVVTRQGTGSGKTSQTIDYLRTVKTLIWATPNQALSYNTHTRICDSETQNQGDMIYNKAYTEHNDYIKLLHNLLLKEPNSPEVDAWKREIMRTEQKLIDVKAFCSTIKHYNRDFKYKGDYKTPNKPDKTQMDKADTLLVCLNRLPYINPHEIDELVIDVIETFLHQFFDNETVKHTNKYWKLLFELFSKDKCIKVKSIFSNKDL